MSRHVLWASLLLATAWGNAGSGNYLGSGDYDASTDLSGGDAQVDRNDYVQEITLVLDETFDATDVAHQNAAKQAVLDALSIEGDDLANYSVVVDPENTQQIVVTHTVDSSEDISTAEDAVADSSTFNGAVQVALQSALSLSTAVSSSTANTITDLMQDELTKDEYDAIATDDSSVVADKCLDDDGYIDGYSNGQSIEMDYENSRLKQVAGKTVLEVHFKVPARYHAEYNTAAFAITFHDRDTESPDRSACWTNRNSYNECPTPNGDWSSSAWVEPNGDTNECFFDYTADFGWEDIFDGHFRAPTSQQNGSAFQVVITADIERWTTFSQSHATGRLDWDEVGGSRDSPRTDGSWSEVYSKAGEDMPDPISGAAAGDININTERYEFYQIPFILNFQNQVTAEANFQIGSAITIVTAVVGQDLVEINMDPSAPLREGQDQAFARLDVTVRTSVNYPFAVMGVGDDTNPNTPIVSVTNGDNLDASRGTDGIAFVKGQDANHCRANGDGQTCDQELTFRVYPANCNSASGEFQLEFWIECIVPDEGCPVDKRAGDGDLAVRKTSNSYNTLTFFASTGNFCPVVLDEYKIDATLRVYQDDSYDDSVEMSLLGASQSDYIRERTDRGDQGVDSGTLVDASDAYHHAFLNDVVYLRAEYYAYTDKKTLAKKSKDEIDFARATSIYVDAKLPMTELAWRQWANTGTTLTILAQDGDITGDINGDGSINDADSDGIDYRVVLCGLDDLKLGANIIREWGDLQSDEDLANYRSLDCFSADRQGNAIDFLDFNPSYDETADPQPGPLIPTEKEIRFNLRLDERIFPMAPIVGSTGRDSGGSLDDSANGMDQTNLRFTVESEIYYKGNRQPTRRRLQLGDQPSRRERVAQTSVSSNRLVLQAPQTIGNGAPIEPCMVDEDRETATLVMWASMDSAFVPTRETAQDWETNFSFQVSNIYGSMNHDQVKVLSLTACESDSADAHCKTVFSSFRRLEGARLMRVKFQITGDSKKSGAFYVNRFQELVVDPKNPLEGMVSVFRGAKVHEMTAVECGQPIVVPPPGVKDSFAEIEATEESAAPRALAGFLGGVVALMTYLLF